MSVFLGILLFLLYPILKLSDEHGKSIVVVEYEAISSPHFTPEERLVKNAEQYVKIIENVTNKYAVIFIIFPEATLDDVKTTKDLKAYAVELEQGDIPCGKTQYPLYLRMLSCATLKHRTSILVNLIGKKDYKIFTCDVIINFEGGIEYSLPREDRIGVDVLHNFPIPLIIPVKYFYVLIFKLDATILAMKFTITSIVSAFRFSYEKIVSLTDYRVYIISSSWISQLPFLTSLQVYQMWAQEFNMTIFFSGAHDPKNGMGGTGIYEEDGPILMDISATNGTKIFVYNFTNDQTAGALAEPMQEKSVDDLAKEMDNFHLEKDPDLFRYNSIILNLTQIETNVSLLYSGTNNFISCNFEIKLSINDSVKTRKQYTYHLVAYKGYKTYYHIFEPGGVEVCAVIACLNSEVSSCGERFEKYDEVGWPITFEKIVITATFGLPIKEKIYYSSQFPNSLLSSIRPIHPKFTTWSKEIITNAGNISRLERTFALNEPHSRILTFGIFGRNFTLYDPRPSCQVVNDFHPLCIVLSLFFITFI